MENKKIIEHPGYFGKKRDEVSAGFDQLYGKGNWDIMYLWNDVLVPRSFGIQLYEDAYYEYLKKAQDVLDWLITTASDVYDTAPSNVEAGLSYDRQETPNNHVHDVAIRRAVMRLGCTFQGTTLMQVRGEKTLGYQLSPHIVPFHLPNLIYVGEIKDYPCKGKWWRNLGIFYSIEEFYQQNKVLVLK